MKASGRNGRDDVPFTVVFNRGDHVGNGPLAVANPNLDDSSGSTYTIATNISKNSVPPPKKKETVIQLSHTTCFMVYDASGGSNDAEGENGENLHF